MSDDTLDELFRPIAISWWTAYLRKALNRNSRRKTPSRAISNIGYSLQYAEFLNHQCTRIVHNNRINNFNYHFTVQKLIIKTFVITSMSIVEAILFYLLVIYDRLGISDRPHLATMIELIKNDDMLAISENAYKKITYLKDLRNRIHIHDVSFHTDWHSFSLEDHKLAKKVLCSILTSDLFKPEKSEKEKLDWLSDSQ